MKWYYLTPLILQKAVCVPTRIVFELFAGLEVRGLTNLTDVKGNVIFASNHSSELDPILLPASLPFFSRFSPIFYASREKSFYKRSGLRQNIYGGTFFKMWGAHKVYSGLKDYGASLVDHVKLLDEGKNIFVFPEGAKTKDGQMQPAHGGIGYLVSRTKKTVVPVAISGAYKSAFKDFFTFKKHITLTIGVPIAYEDFVKVHGDAHDVETYKSYAQFAMDKVERMLPLSPVTEKAAKAAW